MSCRMHIREPVLNVQPYSQHGPVLGHTLELVIRATVPAGGRFASCIEAPPFSWWETITHWTLNAAGTQWVRGQVTGPVDQAQGNNNTANFWRDRYANAVDDPNWPRNWPRNPSNAQAESLIAQNGLGWSIRVYDNPGMNNPRNQRTPGSPRNLARSVEFAICVGPYLIRKTQLLVSSSRGDCQMFLDGTYDAANIAQYLP